MSCTVYFKALKRKVKHLKKKFHTFCDDIFYVVDTAYEKLLTPYTEVLLLLPIETLSRAAYFLFFVEVVRDNGLEGSRVLGINLLPSLI